MNIAEAKNQVKDTVEAYLTKDADDAYVIAPAHQRPLFLIGAPGIGKTAIMEQIAHELGIGLVSYSMTHHTRQSALGLPLITHHDFDGFSYDASEYTMSEIIASLYDYMTDTGLRRGILFLDEVNCVSETLYPSMLQFLQFKTFGRHRVPDDWVVVCAGNPPEYNKSVHEFDIVTLDRLRKVDVEPDYAAWKAYADESGVHPSITTYLEVKKDDFYSVETKPGGKSFVTARGWSDLSDIITLFERLGKTVDVQLVSQFLQDPQIAERFALYYDLFNKYRSDYQIDRILAGTAPATIVERGRAAAFDERVALVGLLLDALGEGMAAAVQSEQVLVALRDALRQVKPLLIGAGDATSAPDALAVVDDLITDREASAAAARAKNTRSAAQQRTDKQATDALKELRAACVRERATTGPAAFSLMSNLFQQKAAQLEPLADHAESQLAHVFSYLDLAFGNDREMLVFVSELTAHKTTAQFISTFGSPSYYAHNEGLMVDAHSLDLLERIDALGLGDAESTAAATPPTTAAKPSLDEAALRAYYAGSQFEYGFVSLCKMTLPDNLTGKTVLDLGCRRGKGVFKLSERVGVAGHAIGVDWSPAFIEEARNRMDHAWHKTGLPANNMAFYVGAPENLAACGIKSASLDVIFVNSVSNLFFDMPAAYAEMFRVLKPGGVLINETVLADRERNQAVVDAARAIGNSVQAAPSVAAYESLLVYAGFNAPTYHSQAPIAPDAGALPERPADVVAASEDVRFTALVATIKKS